MEKLGYDRDLYSLRSRLFTINFHSRILEAEGGSIEVRVRDAVPTDISTRTTEMILEQFGKEMESGEGYKVLEHVSETTQIYTYGVKNTGTANIEATIDMSAAENMSLNSKGFLVKRNVKANDVEIMLSA